MESIEKYYQRESGPAYLLGNGPSLARACGPILTRAYWDVLPVEQTITMNRSWKCVPKARYWLNTCNIDQARKTPQNIVYLGPDEDSVRQNLLDSIKCPVILLQTSGAKLRTKHLKLDIPADLDLRNGWPRNSNIGLVAIFWAWWVGFNPIVCIGYDGYGKHFVSENLDRREDLYATKHDKAIKEYQQRIRALPSHIKIYNTNPYNTYGMEFRSLQEVV
jgi:hypothetical protein